jgi:F420-non-reducing hydrogenase iron-sulfur subunit
VEYARKLLQQIGLQGQRVQMINVSSAMGGQFAFSAAELTEEIRLMGPNPLKNSNHVPVENQQSLEIDSEMS